MSKSCFTSNLRNLLKKNGVMFSEALVSCFTGYVDFMYSDEGTDEYLLGARKDNEQMLYQLCDDLNIKIINVASENYLEALSTVKKKLNQNISILAWVNDFYIAYTTYYKTFSNYRIAHISGISEDTHEIICFDMDKRKFTQTKFKEIWIDLECDKKYKWYELEKESGNINPNKILKNGIYKIYSNLIKNEVRSPGKYGGVEGMRKFASDLKEIGKCCSEIERSQKMFRTYVLLSRPSGPKITRSLLADALEEIALDKEVSILKKLAIKYKKISCQWETVSNLIFKASTLSYSESSSFIEQVARRIEKLASDEEWAIKELKDVAEQICGKD